MDLIWYIVIGLVAAFFGFGIVLSAEEYNKLGIYTLGAFLGVIIYLLILILMALT